MISERILSLDMSSKTGWALIVSTSEGPILEKFGMIPQMSEPPGQYPVNYVEWANKIFDKINSLIKELSPDILVIEETVAGSKQVYSQKILEWIHFLVAQMIRDTGIKARYLLTGTWRSEVGCIMTDAERRRNKEVREYKKREEKKTGKKTTIAYDINGKRIGLINKKHVNIRRANEVFGSFLQKPLTKKNEDEADALLLGYCYHLRRIANELSK